ncbi:MAG: tetratricopeptide repeat protein [Deltaproteobacteria bacterium]|nr:tetratricopeptide repeat protein [Deltaproteobacteria bacterium]MBW2020956.1 tetratricopeptide repeat protein [Deltaproteobacteria bacterium]
MARLLNASSGVACLFYEGNVLYRLWRTLCRHDVLTEPHEDLVADIKITAEHNLIDRAEKSGSPKIVFSPSAVSRLIRNFENDLSNAEDPLALYGSTAACFFHLLGCTADVEVVGDKVPDYINIPDILNAALPSCKMIYIQRDPMATIHSVLRFIDNKLHLFAVPNAFAMAFSFLLKYKGMNDFVGHLPKNRLFPLTQAELLNNPKQIAIKASEFLGSPVCAEMISCADSMAKRRCCKNWRVEMAKDNIAAVEAVCIQSGINLPAGPVIDTKKNCWFEKADKTKLLIHCASDRIRSVMDDVRAAFRGAREEETLGLTLIQFADYAHTRAQFKRAYLFFEEASRLIPYSPVLWFKFAELCFDMKLLSEARKHYERAEALFQKTNCFALLRAKTFYGLGRIERLSGNCNDARSFFERSLTVFPNFKLSQAMLQFL